MAIKKVLYTFENYRPNGGQALLPPVRRDYARVPHNTDLPVPDEPSPPFEFLPRYKDWVIGHDEELIIEDVTPVMLDWFWANLEKCYLLWAPGDHTSFEWINPPSRVGFVGSSHFSSQSFYPGGPQGGNLALRVGMDSYPFTTCLDHCYIEKSTISQEITSNTVTASGMEAYYIAQWSGHPKGCLWRCSVIMEPRDVVQMQGWTSPSTDGDPEPSRGTGDASQVAHGVYENARLTQFLPALYNIWKVVPDPGQNVPNDLRVTREADGAWRYVNPYKPPLR